MTKQRVLVVEDHKLLLQAIRDLLESQGYEVYLALNGIEALEIMQDVTPNLILSDIMMPQMDGYTFYERVRENPEWVRIPFIFLTARGQHEDIKRGKALGVEDYLTKPFDTEEVAIAVRSRLRRAEAIHQATEREFDTLKQDIINVLSHELRTPLTYIAGYTDLALEDASDLSTDELVTFLQGIKKGANRLHSLVEDMLIGVQIDTSRSRQEYEMFANVSTELDEIIHVTVQSYGSMADEQEVTLEEELPDDLPPIRLYPPFFKDALGRIIDNGIKFSSTPGHVRVKAEADGEQVKIHIRDNGPGIPEEQKQYIYQRLQQLNRNEMEQQGTGMGLFIARSYIDMHGGEITLESEVGEGSTFTITLPAAETA